MTLIAKNAFGDLFLRNEQGTIFQLKIGAGKLHEIANSEMQFRELAETREKREEWFAESEETASAAQGLTPNENQCIGFSVPLVFAESRSTNTPFVVDIYIMLGFSETCTAKPRH